MHLVYKCRQCGRLDTSTGGSDQLLHMVLIEVSMGRTPTQRGVPAYALDICDHPDGSRWLSDLQGMVPDDWHPKGDD